MLTYDMDQRGSNTLYAYLYSCLRADIESGELRPGERLPSKRPFAHHLGVSVITVEGAYRQLLAEGYVESFERRGHFVSRNLPERAPDAARARRPPDQRAAVPPVEEDRLSSGALFPLSSWARITRALLSEEDERSIMAETSPLGSLRLRGAICHQLRQARGLVVEPWQVVVGAGSQLLDAMLVQLLGRDRLFAVEDPGYPQLTALYQANGVRVAHVAVDGEGMLVDALRSSGASVAHVTPSHQFPTGVVMSVGRRYELLSWASEAPGRYVIEDDYDCEFRLSGLPVPPLSSLDAEGRVIYTNTFTKSLGPAFRIAYAVLPPELVHLWGERLGFCYGSVGAIDQLALARVIESGSFERHVNRMRTRFRRVRDQLLEALRASELGPLVSVRAQDAGLHFVLRLALPSQADDAELERRAREGGVPLRAMAGFFACGSSRRGAPHEFIVSYSGVSPEETGRLVEALVDVVRDLS